MPPEIRSIDHFVLTVASIEVTAKFYADALGMGLVEYPEKQSAALTFGTQKINLHQVGKELSPRATLATPGTGDFCLITDTPVAEVAQHLESVGIAVELGPVPRTGATGPINSVYFRDPDGNLVEVSNLA